MNITKIPQKVDFQLAKLDDVRAIASTYAVPLLEYIEAGPPLSKHWIFCAADGVIYGAYE